MRDHQFDWNSIYSMLDHINDLEKSIARTQSDQHPVRDQHRVISSRKRGHAKTVVNRLVVNAIRSIQEMDSLSSREKSATCDRIKHLNTYDQKVLSHSNSNGRINTILRSTRLQLRKIIANKHLDDVTQATISSIHRAALTKQQQSEAITEAKSTVEYAKNDLFKAQRTNSIHNTVTSFHNALDGALIKYIIDNKINAINHINGDSRKIKQQITKASNTDSEVKKFALRMTETIRTNSVVSLMTKTNDKFVTLRRIQEQGDKSLHQVLASVHNLNQFSMFVSQVVHVVVNLPLSVNTKFSLKAWVDKAQRTVLSNLSRTDQQFDRSSLISREQQMSSSLIGKVSRYYQNRITEQALNLSKVQRHRLVTSLAQVTDQIQQKLRQPLKTPVRDVLTKSLQHLNQIFNQENDLSYDNQVDLLMTSVKNRINQFTDFASTDKHYLGVLVTNFGKAAKHRRPRMEITQVKVSLQKLFKEQTRYIEFYSLNYQLTRLYGQIKASHLSSAQKKDFHRQLIHVHKNQKLNYSNKLLFIKTIQNYSLVLDQHENLNRLTELSRRVTRHVSSANVLVLRQKLEQNLYNFDHNLDRITDVPELDHREQLCENFVYRTWYQMVSQASHVKMAKLADVTKLVKRVHSRIDLAVLKPWLNHSVNDHVDQLMNQRLYKIGNTYDEDRMTAQIKKLKHGIKQQMKAEVARTKRVYAAEITRFVRDLQSRLVAYPEFKSVLGKIGQIRSRATMRLNDFRDLIHVERIKQINMDSLNQIINSIVDSGSPAKLNAHREVASMVKRVKKELLAHRSTSDVINLAYLNRTMMVKNHANDYINRDLDSHVSEECQHCRKSLNMILRHSYLHRWSRTVSQTQAALDNLTSIAADIRQHTIHQIMVIKAQVAHKITYNNVNQLFKTLRDNQAKVQKIAKKTIYLDPIKKNAFRKLNHLTNRVISYVIGHTKGKALKYMRFRLLQLRHQTSQKISSCPDKDVATVYSAGKKKIEHLELKLVRGVEIRRFTLAVRNLSKQFKLMQFLAGNEKRRMNVQFNRGYHKAVYDITHAPDKTYCMHNEQQGEQQMQVIFRHAVHVNTYKYKVYKTVQEKAQSARNQVQKLDYIAIGDKRNSDRLLQQAQRQALYSIRTSTNHKKTAKVKKDCVSVVQQIIDEVSSADVLLAALKRADDMVYDSSLNDTQKQATLKQIHAIFNSGIKVQQDKKADYSRHAKADHRSSVAKSKPKAAKSKAKQPSTKAKGKAEKKKDRRTIEKPQATNKAVRKGTAEPKAHWSVMSQTQFKHAMFREHLRSLTKPLRSLLKKLGKVF